MKEAEPDPLPPGYELGRYLIECELAPAGMGRAYRALDTVLKGVVAINVLAPALREPDGLMRFRMCFRKAFDRNRGRVHEYAEVQGIPFAVVAYDAERGMAVDVSVE
jgi:hypothetical protein